MVVDDRAIVRGLIFQLLERDPGISVVARAANGQAALSELDRTPVGVVVLDVEMPVMEGLTALPLILQKRPEVKVVMASTLTRRNARISLQALQAGAADYVPKPETGGLVGADEFARELTAKVQALGQSGDGGRGYSSTTPTASTPAPAAPLVRAALLSPPVRPQVVAIGGSTGAPPALMSLFADLKGELEQAVLLTASRRPTSCWRDRRLPFHRSSRRTPGSRSYDDGVGYEWRYCVTCHQQSALQSGSRDERDQKRGPL